MHRRLIITGLLLVLALPLAASQFIEQSFDQVASEARYIVRGSVGQTFSKWDDAHEVIYTYAVIHVDRYFGETTGPDTLMVREVGGTVDGYTMEAIGFPEVRTGERVVLMLSQWDDSGDLRIHAFNQGKYLVRNRGGVEVLISDPVKQGEARLDGPGREIAVDAYNAPGLRMREFEEMVEAARSGHRVDIDKSHKQ